MDDATRPCSCRHSRSPPEQGDHPSTAWPLFTCPKMKPGSFRAAGGSQGPARPGLLRSPNIPKRISAPLTG